MRDDTAGMFWDDTPPPKVLKTQEKRTPPEPVWLSPDYLPHLEEARAWTPNLYTDGELRWACAEREPLLFDVESYPNYFLIGFVGFRTGKYVIFESSDVEGAECRIDVARLRWVLENFLIVGFNSRVYDQYLAAMALHDDCPAKLNRLTIEIIEQDLRGHDMLKARKIKMPKLNHVDLIEVAPLSASLKIYAGRLHAPTMQDLPFPPGTMLSNDQRTILRWYWGHDATNTAFVYAALQEQLKLRAAMSAQYGMDLRSKSDAQIAETVIVEQVEQLNGVRPKRPEFEYGALHFYQPPAFLQYKSDLLNYALNVVRSNPFVVEENGTMGMPPALKELRLTIGGSTYQMGMGGLHSNESRAVWHAGSDGEQEWCIIDRDVESYYPRIILNCQLYPKHLGTNFLRVYGGIVDRRVEAKRSGNKTVADALKITINGTFGKLGSPWSTLYAPDLMVQVTLTGQLSLLMLIETLELAGFPVVSGNTDGIVVRVPKHRREQAEAIFADWEQRTGFKTEETEYRTLASRDVNNYIAVTVDGKVKAKGAYTDPWSDPKQAIFRFHKNPSAQISVQAAHEYVAKGVPPEVTVATCTDVRRFVCVRHVNGGAVKDGVYLGKAIRWYYAQGESGEIVYARSGNKVPRSDGARPLMTLPPGVPVDLDRGWYVREAWSLIHQLGYEVEQSALCSPEPTEE